MLGDGGRRDVVFDWERVSWLGAGLGCGGWNLRRLTLFYVLKMWGIGEDL